jgi:hypothetical protein
MTDKPVPLLERARLITNWYDGEMALLLNMSRASVQAMRCGRTPEYLSAEQRRTLIDAIRDFLKQGGEELEELEIFL